MPNVRPLNKRKYEISKHRFYELYHFCLQYNDWLQELNLLSEIKSTAFDGMPYGQGYSDRTGNLAIRKSVLKEKCELIEKTAEEADADICKYILKAVTNEGVTYAYLKTVLDIPCGKDLYYNRRRRFYYLLSKKI